MSANSLTLERPGQQQGLSHTIIGWRDAPTPVADNDGGWLDLFASGLFHLRYVSTARSRLLPSISGALTRQFADRPLKGAREHRAIRFREPCVCVPVQRDAPELPYETSSVG